MSVESDTVFLLVIIINGVGNNIIKLSEYRKKERSQLFVGISPLVFSNTLRLLSS